MKFARARDANEREIVQALRAIGCSVTPLDGTGVPDLLVGWLGRTVLLEVKRADVKRTTRGDRTDARGLLKSQQMWWNKWRGAPPILVRTPEEAIAAVRGIGEP